LGIYLFDLHGIMVDQTGDFAPNRIFSLLSGRSRRIRDAGAWA